MINATLKALRSIQWFTPKSFFLASAFSFAAYATTIVIGLRGGTRLPIPGHPDFVWLITGTLAIICARKASNQESLADYLAILFLPALYIVSRLSWVYLSGEMNQFNRYMSRIRTSLEYGIFDILVPMLLLPWIGIQLVNIVIAAGDYIEKKIADNRNNLH